MKKYLFLVLVLTLLALPLPAATTSTIVKDGVTFTFDHAYEYGTFANGDYWVVGPVTITAITPEFSGGRNGWQVNPAVSAYHGWDSRNSLYDATKVPALPYTSSSLESICHSILSSVYV